MVRAIPQPNTLIPTPQLCWKTPTGIINNLPHQTQMAMFTKNISKTKKEVWIIDDDLVEVEEDNEVEVVEEVYDIDEMENDNDNDDYFVNNPPAPKARTTLPK